MNNIETKKVNTLFLGMVLITLLAEAFVSILSVKGIKINIIMNLLLSQMIILVPGLIFYVCAGPFKIYRRLRSLSVLLLLVFTWLLMPLVTAANIFSQIFTKNEVARISDSVLELPLPVMIAIMGLLGPFCEEFVFRGIIYNCFVKRTGRFVMSGVISGLFFGLMHMNFNQFCYAFVLGVVFALINEVLESTWPSFICHAIVNTQNVLLLYVADKIVSAQSGLGIGETYSSITEGAMANGTGMKIAFLIMFVILLLISVITTALAGLLLYGISALEGREDKFKSIYTKGAVEKKEKLLSVTGYIAIVLCIFVMFFMEPIIKMISK